MHNNKISNNTVTADFGTSNFETFGGGFTVVNVIGNILNNIISYNSTRCSVWNLSFGTRIFFQGINTSEFVFENS